MSRYIEVSKAMELCNEFYFSEETCSVKGLFDSAPSIDIIRCGECKYNSMCNHSVQHTTRDAFSITIGNKPVDFCSWGEREGE